MMANEPQSNEPPENAQLAEALDAPDAPVPRPERTVRLENWSLHLRAPRGPYSDPALCKPYLVGDVFGYPNRADGHHISTGSIYGVDGNVAWGRRTTYVLGTPSPGYVAWCAEQGHVFDPANPIRFRHS